MGEAMGEAMGTIPRLDKTRLDLQEKEREKEKIPPTPKGGDALKSQKPKSPRFVPPTVAQVHEHCLEKGYDIDAEAFVAFYDSKGWMIGKNKMKDWKRAIVTWVKRQDKRTSRPAYQSREDRVRAADEERRRRLAEYDRNHDGHNTSDITGFLSK
jgi:hypothetical protein